MASTSDFQSENEIASDGLIDPYCEVCIKDGSVSKVAGYCMTCVEFYCQTCCEFHQQATMTKSHKLLLSREMPKSMEDKPEKYYVCNKHGGEVKDKYCFGHHIIICGLCNSKEHKQCEVQSLEHAYQHLNISEEKLLKVSLVLQMVNALSQSLTTNREDLDKLKVEYLKDGQQYRDKIINQIHQSYQDFTLDVEKIFSEQNENLSNRLLTLDKIGTSVTSGIDSETNDHNDKHNFMAFRDFAEKIQVYEDVIKSPEYVHINIKCNFSFQPLIVSSNPFWKFSVQSSTFLHDTDSLDIDNSCKGFHQDNGKTNAALRGQSQVPTKLTWSGQTNICLDDDEENSCITGLDNTKDGNLLVADANNDKVKLFTPDGFLLSALKLPGKPKAITVINESRAAISMANKKIGFILIRNGKLDFEKKIGIVQEALSIAMYKDDLIIGCEKSLLWPGSLQMIDMEGNILYAGKSRFKYPLGLIARPDSDTVIVADSIQQTVSVLKAFSGEVVKICDAKGKEPLDVTVDDNGNVYVCYKSGEISVWSTDMEEETHLACACEKLQSPYAMVYDCRRSELLITTQDPKNNYNNFIHRFKIS